MVAIESLLKIGSLEAVPPLIDALSSRWVRVRHRAHAALELLTFTEIAFAAAAPATEREAAATRWREHWQLNGAKLELRQRWDRLRSALEAAVDPAEAERLREQIVALGEGALPEIEVILAGDSYAFDWILVREAMTGERRGL